MTIEIDDAGTGDLVGDAFIGLFRKETNHLIFKKVPLEMFNEENWKRKRVYEIVVDLVKEGLAELEFQKDKDTILICRGNIFDQVRTYFNEEGIKYNAAIIEGKLQEAIEGRYISHLRNDLGIMTRSLTTKSGAKRYFVLFNWVSRDFIKREKYVKSGFKRWKTIWRQKAIEKYNNYNNSFSKQNSKK